MHIERWDAARDGELSEAALRQKLERQGYSVSRYVYPPGTYFPNHTHDVDKLDAVLSGALRITTNDGVADLGPGDAICVPRGAVHSAEVIGSQSVLSLDAVKVR
jgi:quercetin dioxygenase-like cupin family protein